MDDTSVVKLFVGNLAVETSQDDLIALFAPYGKLETITLLRQFAFVHLQGEADLAIRGLNGIEFRGRTLVVEESRGRPQNSIKVYVGNLSALCTTDELHELFSRFGNVLECEKVKTKPNSSVGYTFVHMEHQENAENAIEALHGTSYMGRPLSVELSKVQQTKPAAVSKVPCARCGTQGHFAGECPTRPPLEHHQSQAAVLAAAAAAAAGLPIQVQQSVHNSFFNTNTSDPTYAALKGLTEGSGSAGKPVSAAVYGALASQVYGSVADQVYGQGTGDSGYPPAVEAPSATTATNPVYGTNASAYTGPAYGSMGGAEADPQAIFEAARQRFIEQGQQVLAEQQAITKPDRDRSPVRRSALLPDPVPQPISAARPKRRALLPTPPGGPEMPAIKEGDPIARCYAEYVQQYQQYQHYQQYQQYQQYQYYYPPPPPPPQMPTMPMPPSGQMDGNHLAAPGTSASPRAMHLRLSSVFHFNAERWWGTCTNTNTHTYTTWSH
ncbi:RNA-binding protein 14a isoform X1 [Clarias gariepinus]|uniref:RNA-binding protein 14a isoform X1 n=1 Tax=Clarias gariepinus TaxID=13013 RepID=UPI00234D02BD|nr:RNA-binding protein 14a isoform X1 [Clarias gariepinus]XP_053334499.1 RNA-binding protein 14a isoform X1 [Clarias gariepinus]